MSSAGSTIALVAGSKGRVTVDGAGSTWTNSGTLSVGDRGGGTLIIQNGAVVSNGAGTIGRLAIAGGSGSVTVDGAGSTWTNSGTLKIGDAGTGTLTISNGGTVSATGTVSLAQQSGSTGTLNIGAASGQAAAAPGTLSAASVAFGAGSGKIVFNHTGSAYAFAPVISGSGSVSVKAGTTILTGSNTYTGGTTITAGTLQLGNGGTTGSIVGSVDDNATLAFNRSDTVTFGGAISGTGAVTRSAPAPRS